MNTRLSGNMFVPGQHQDLIIGLAILIANIATAETDDLLGDIKKDTQAIREGQFNTGIDYLNAIKETELSESQINKYLEESEKCFRNALGVYKKVLCQHPLIEFYIGFIILVQGRKDGFHYLQNSLSHAFEHFQYAMHYTSFHWNEFDGKKKQRNISRMAYGPISLTGPLILLSSLSPIGVLATAINMATLAYSEYQYRKAWSDLEKIVSTTAGSLIGKLLLLKEMVQYDQQIAQVWNENYYQNIFKWYKSLQESRHNLKGYWRLTGFESGELTDDYREEFKNLEEKLEIRIS